MEKLIIKYSLSTRATNKKQQQQYINTYLYVYL